MANVDAESAVRNDMPNLPANENEGDTMNEKLKNCLKNKKIHALISCISSHKNEAHP
jgi:hypothetical protein